MSVDPQRGTYTQHYFDSRGVVRLYAMTLTNGAWQLLRTKPDFTPLDFSQRFRGKFSKDRMTIKGAWEASINGKGWKHDFDLTYRKVKHH